MHGRRKSQLHNAAYPQQAKSDPLVEVPDDLLETSFKQMMQRMFPNVPVGSHPYQCLERSWYLGVMFMQGFQYTMSFLPREDALQCLQGIEEQCKAHFTKLRTQRNAGTTDSAANSGANPPATDNPGEQDPGHEEQPGGEDASSARGA